jgi:Flp pilus assembly protein TadB
VAGTLSDVVRRQHGTTAAIVFVVVLCCAAVVLLIGEIPLVWAIVVALAIGTGAVRMARDIRGNKAM